MKENRPLHSHEHFHYNKQKATKVLMIYYFEPAAVIVFVSCVCKQHAVSLWVCVWVYVWLCVREWMCVKSWGHICQSAGKTTKCQLMLLNDLQPPAYGYSGQQRINTSSSQPPPLNIGQEKLQSTVGQWMLNGFDPVIGWMIHRFTMKVWAWCLV